MIRLLCGSRSRHRRTRPWLKEALNAATGLRAAFSPGSQLCVEDAFIRQFHHAVKRGLVRAVNQALRSKNSPQSAADGWAARWNDRPPVTVEDDPQLRQERALAEKRKQLFATDARFADTPA